MTLYIARLTAWKKKFACIFHYETKSLEAHETLQAPVLTQCPPPPYSPPSPFAVDLQSSFPLPPSTFFVSFDSFEPTLVMI